MENLQSQYVHLQSQFVSVRQSNDDRNELLSNGRPSYWQGNDDDEDDDDEPLGGYSKRPGSSEPTVDDLRKQQDRILEDQNQGLDVLSKVISRQKTLALRIGDEFEDQNGTTSQIMKQVRLLTNFQDIILSSFSYYR